MQVPKALLCKALAHAVLMAIMVAYKAAIQRLTLDGTQ